MNIKDLLLTEDTDKKSPKEFMTKRESKLKDALISMLRDDGKGHRHAKFAERLKDFIVKIVAIRDDPEMTAAINFDDGIIYISEGFLTSKSLFYQLNVLMRHELGHYLLMHQIRMLRKLVDKYGDEAKNSLSMSHKWHDLMNILEDFEISHKLYTKEDEETVRHMILNGKWIGGLLTVDQMKNWVNMSVEEMYDAFEQLITNDHKRVLSYTTGWDDTEPDPKKMKRAIQYIYGDNDSPVKGGEGEMAIYGYTLADPTNFLGGNIEKYMQDKALYHFIAYDQGKKPCIIKYSHLPELYQKLVKALYDAVIKHEGDPTPYTKKEVDEMIKKIGFSSPISQVDILAKTGEVIATIYTPEEKLLAMDVLKALKTELELKTTWYNKVMKALSDGKYSAQDITDILNKVKV